MPKLDRNGRMNEQNDHIFPGEWSKGIFQQTRIGIKSHLNAVLPWRLSAWRHKNEIEK